MTISLIRTLLLYIVIIVAVRLMGKRQISELQTSELVVTLLISDIAAIPMQNTGQPLVSGFIPIAVLVSCEIFVSALMMKNSKFRRFVCGKPIIVINDGKVDEREMRRLRMSTEDLGEQLRQLDVFSIADVAYAIVETNGRMSVMKKPDKQQPDASMLGIVVPNNGIEAVVVSDGVLSSFSMQLCGVTEEWIDGVLAGEKISRDQVLIMTANKKRSYQIIKKEEVT
jgi:uncharacterized membrane protein YcaP (DUF421 family)